MHITHIESPPGGHFASSRRLLESGQADMAKLVRDYVASLSADEKTDEATYAARLNICRTCDDLHSGTCALCGCYVEARAAKKRQGCPKVPEKWGAEEAE